MNEPTQNIFELILARPIVTDAGEHPSLVHLFFRVTQPLAQTYAFQAYVNGQLHTVIADSDAREVLLALDRSRPNRIEMLAVDPLDATRPMPERLQTFTPAFVDRAAISLLRDESLPYDAVVDVELDSEPYAQRALWTGGDNRSGFGSLFGLGDFGVDGATGPGLGRGQLGHGPLGCDATAWTLAAPLTAAGSHTLEHKLLDAALNPIAPAQTQTVTADLPDAAALELTLTATQLQW